MSDAISVEGLRFAYASLASDAPALWVIDGLSLNVRRGEWLAVMGASDVGKTTLCYLLAGLAPHLTGGTVEGRVVVGGHDTSDYPPPALADAVGLLFQEPEAQLFNPTVEAEVAWGLENLGLPVSEIRAQVDRMLALLRLDLVRHRAPGELSGGEKKRLALASVLAMSPALLILDEPMGGLDPVGRREVLQALSHLRSRQAEGSVTIVMTESDPEAVAAFADRLVVLHRGQIVLEGSPRALFARAEQLASLGVAVPQIAQLTAALNRRLGAAFDFMTVEEALVGLLAPLSRPGQDLLGSPLPLLPSFSAGPDAQSILPDGLSATTGSRERSAEQLSPSKITWDRLSSLSLFVPGGVRKVMVTPSETVPSAPLRSRSGAPVRPDHGSGLSGGLFIPRGDQPGMASPGKPGGAGFCLEAAGLWFWYDRESTAALRGLDLRVSRGQLLALVGANGSGKTTLIKHFNGLLRPRRGQVRIEGQDAAHRSVGELARQVGFLFQHPEQQIFGSTIRQELAFGPRNLGLPPDEVEARVEAALLRFDLMAVVDTPPAILSYGLRRRVTLASLAAMDPPILVLDEPTVGLDAFGLRETFDWLAGLRAQGRTILLVTHDMGLVGECADRMVVLHEGQILADGRPAELFKQADLLARASLVPPPVMSLAQALEPHGFRDEGLSVAAFCDRFVEWAEGPA